MSKDIKKVVVKVPHRISGFFEIVDKIAGVEITDPVKIGSRGAGFCVTAVGKTEIIKEHLKNKNEIEIEININGKTLNQNAETTYYIVDYIKDYLGKYWKVKVNHFFDMPVGCGYGASGSGALGTIFGLDYLFKLNLSNHEKGKIAHIAEVVNRTGLGTVCGQLNGGIGILKESGFPCVYEKIKIPPGLKVLCGSFGVIPTKSILTDPILSQKIKDAGKKALESLMNKPNINTFMHESIEFVKSTEILEILELDNVKDLMNDLNRLDIIGASMNQLGRSVYAMCRKKDEDKVLDVFDSYKPSLEIFKTSIQKNKGINLKPSKRIE